MQSEGNDDHYVEFKGDVCSGDLLAGEKIPGRVEVIQQKRRIVLLWPFSPWASGSFVNFCKGNVILLSECIVLHEVSDHIRGMIPVNFSHFKTNMSNTLICLYKNSVCFAGAQCPYFQK